MMKSDFSYYLTKYFSEYLPDTLGASCNTIKSYRDTFVHFIKFLDYKHHIKPSEISFDDIDVSIIEEFLIWLEEEKQMATTTRNQRLAAIHSFFRYIQYREFQYFDLCSSILQIKFKKCSNSIISYFTLDELKFLLNIPNKNSKQEYRDLTLMVLLYDSGARVQEIIDLKLKQLQLDNKPIVYLNGKGNKTRIVPITTDSKSIVQKYLKDNNITNPEENIFRNKQNEPLTRVGINYIINKYVDIARKQRADYFKNKISPHCFRHSKAMHLLEAGVNLIYIRDFLGHVSVTTTEIYAKANPEIKRKVIETNSSSLNIKNNKYDSNKKQELLQWLKDNV